MSGKPGITELESSTASPLAKRGFGARLKAHFKKWWWVHLIIFCSVFLIICLPVVYVAYPRIAQSDVNDSTLNITSMTIANPTPTSFHLIQKQVLGTHSIFHPKIYSFLASVSLLGAANAFTSVEVPEVKANDGAAIDVDQVVDLSNASAFGDFATAVMLNEEVKLNIYGKPVLQQGALPKTTVNYNKTVTMKGLNKLTGFEITEFHIMLEAVNGRNMNGTVYIPNPSVMTINMGNVTLDLSVDGQLMGYSYLDDLTLKPGNNTVPMFSNVNQTGVINLVSGNSSRYKDIVPFTISGNLSVYNGQELPYFSKALAANNLTVHLNVSQALAELGIHL